MAVNPGPARRFRIVEMNCHEAIQPDDPIEFAERFFDCAFAGDVVTGGKNMGSVETDTDTVRFADVADDVGQMLEFFSQTRSLPGSSLQSDPGFYAGDARKHAVD